MRLTFKDVVDFVMEGEQAISSTEDAVLKVRYQGMEKNFKFLFGLLCCASRKSPFSPYSFISTHSFCIPCHFKRYRMMRLPTES
jgi:hypothetical protein